MLETRVGPLLQMLVKMIVAPCQNRELFIRKHRFGFGMLHPTGLGRALFIKGSIGASEVEKASYGGTFAKKQNR